MKNFVLKENDGKLIWTTRIAQVNNKKKNQNSRGYVTIIFHLFEFLLAHIQTVFYNLKKNGISFCGI